MNKLESFPMKRKRGRPRKPRKTDGIEDQIIAMSDAGLKSRVIAKQLGIEGRAIRHVLERERIRREAAPDSPVVLAMTAQEKLAAAMRMHQRKLDTAHAERMQKIEEEVRKRVLAENKEYLAKLEVMEKRARDTVTLYKEWTDVLKPILTVAEFNVILKCLDSGAIAFRLKEPDPELVKRFDEAMVIVRNKRDRLTLGRAK